MDAADNDAGALFHSATGDDLGAIDVHGHSRDADQVAIFQRV